MEQFTWALKPKTFLVVLNIQLDGFTICTLYAILVYVLQLTGETKLAIFFEKLVYPILEFFVQISFNNR